MGNSPDQVFLGLSNRISYLSFVISHCQEWEKFRDSLLRDAWRASRLVECVNSVVRIQQTRPGKMTPGLLDLKRLLLEPASVPHGTPPQQVSVGVAKAETAGVELVGAAQDVI